MSTTGTDPGPADRCPCGSGASFGDCCGPLLAGDRGAATAEASMRSRYTAFVLADTDHLARSWHRTTRPAVVDVDPAVTWRFLEVVAVHGGGPFEDAGVVEFRAHHRTGAGRGVLHERSRFVRDAGGWVYVDGDRL